MNARSNTWLAGARCSSATPRASQKTWKTRSPAPYDSRVPCAYDETIASMMRSRSHCVMFPTCSPLLSVAARDASGRQTCSRSRARQWGLRSEGRGVRAGGYARPFRVETDEARGVVLSKRRAVVWLIPCCVGADVPVEGVICMMLLLGASTFQSSVNGFGSCGGVLAFSMQA